MSAFRFQLERVLGWRQTQLSVAEGELAVVLSELNRVESALDALSSREAGEDQSLQSARSLRGSDLARVAVARRWATEERKRLRSRLAECHRSIDLKKAAVMEAQRKVRLLERLKERREESWTSEQNRALEELAAESAVGAWRRQ